jgi:hypothetical protein
MSSCSTYLYRRYVELCIDIVSTRSKEWRLLLYGIVVNEQTTFYIVGTAIMGDIGHVAAHNVVINRPCPNFWKPHRQCWIRPL